MNIDPINKDVKPESAATPTAPSETKEPAAMEHKLAISPVKPVEYDAEPAASAQPETPVPVEPAADTVAAAWPPVESAKPAAPAESVPATPAAVAPTAPEPAKPAFIGNSSVMDKSALASSIYPSADNKPTSVSSSLQTEFSNQQMEADNSFAELTVLGLGMLSGLGIFLGSFFIKNIYILGIISAGLAAATLVFALRNYKQTQKFGPLTVVGLSAATIAFIFVANYVLASLVLRSYSSGVSF